MITSVRASICAISISLSYELATLYFSILIGGGCTAIVYLVLYMNFSEVLPNKGSGEGSDFISVYGTTVTFSLINFSVPSCIRLVSFIGPYKQDCLA